MPSCEWPERALGPLRAITPTSTVRGGARTAAGRTAVGYVSVPGGKHAMLRHGRTFETLAAEFVAATMLGIPPRSAAVSAVLDGAAYVEA